MMETKCAPTIDEGRDLLKKLGGNPEGMTPQEIGRALLLWASKNGALVTVERFDPDPICDDPFVLMKLPDAYNIRLDAEIQASPHFSYRCNIEAGWYKQENAWKGAIVVVSEYSEAMEDKQP